MDRWIYIEDTKVDAMEPIKADLQIADRFFEIGIDDMKIRIELKHITKLLEQRDNGKGES